MFMTDSLLNLGIEVPSYLSLLVKMRVHPLDQSPGDGQISPMPHPPFFLTDKNQYKQD